MQRHDKKSELELVNNPKLLFSPDVLFALFYNFYIASGRQTCFSNKSIKENTPIPIREFASLLNTLLFCISAFVITLSTDGV